MHRSSSPPVQVPIAIPDGCGTKERALEGVIVKGNTSGMQLLLLETRKTWKKWKTHEKHDIFQVPNSERGF